MNKRELMELLFTKEELNKIDTAYPQEWADRMRANGVDPRWYVWSYVESSAFGQPVDLGDKLIEKFLNYANNVMDADLDDDVKAELVRAYEVMKGGIDVS